VGFAAWIASFGLTGGNAGAAADPDNDGLANLIEYIFGLTPVQPGGFQHLPSVSYNAAGHAVLTFSLSATPPADAICEIQASSDLAPGSWQIIASCTGGVWTGPVNSTPQDGRMLVTVTGTVSTGGTTRRFLRLKVRLAE
jgi:hypothetical protein